MAWLRWRPLWLVLRRKLTGCVVLVSYLIATFGFPLPAIADKSGGPAYPCQDLPCGCLSAEQCWSSCCCLTPEQRWAWARDHNVVPPDYAERPASSETVETSLPVTDKPTSEPPCCAKKKKEGVAGGLRWTVGMAAQRCKSSTGLWISAEPGVPPSAPTVWCSAITGVDCLRWADTNPIVVPLAPPDPPPRKPLDNCPRPKLGEGVNPSDGIRGLT